MKPITHADPESHSADPVAANIAKLRELFPEAFTEGKIDFEVLKQLLGGAVDEREEKFGLNWHGKRRFRQLALTPSSGTLRPCPGDDVAEAPTQNIVIEGDNLEVLKLLQKSYSGSVRLIYIDPPYNTGKDFIYPDNFADSIGNYMRLTGQVDGEGVRLTSNPEASGRFHTEWLNMMYPRLMLARNLLQEDGVIAISLDNAELANGILICNELFGPESFLGCVVRATGTTTGQDSGGLGQSFDYLLCYGRSADQELHGLPLEEEDEKRFQDEDAKGKYSVLQLRKTGNADRRTDRPSMYYPVKAPDGSDVFPVGPGGYESRWRFGPAKYAESVDDDMIVWKEVDREGRMRWQPYVKYYLDGRTKRPSPLWDDLDGNKKATIEVRQLLGEKLFSNPKPVALIVRLLMTVFGDQKDGTVLDFFAGSGTTGHAVMAQNAADGGNRRYILVQLPEPLDPTNKDQRSAADFCDSIGKPRNIAELTKERLRRAGNKIRSETPMFKGNTGFRVFKLDSSNIRAWDPDAGNLEGTVLKSVEHLKSDRSEQDVLTELLLKLGLDLCVPIETKTIAKKKVHCIGAGVLLVCLAPEVAKKEAEPLALGIAEWHKKQNPAGESQVVFRDSAFEDDVAKSNLVAILAQHGLTNVRSL